jgi:[calcium/calmodulin-dependent protein kinase] kinase
MADIWQLGVTLYSLVFGCVPFYDENIIKLYEKIQFDELTFPPVPRISPLLKNLIENMLLKNPEKRITLPQIKVSFKSVDVTNSWLNKWN